VVDPTIPSNPVVVVSSSGWTGVKMAIGTLLRILDVGVDALTYPVADTKSRRRSEMPW